MKPPSQPAAFRTSTRHYHRYGQSREDAWDAWVGDERKTGSPALKFTVILLLLAAAAVGAWLLLR